jgi:[citrate (pro-3S)-lyase] ligase
LLDKYLGKYLSYLAAERMAEKGKIGSIVMNCNPLTLGHKYLMEQAAARVDRLYVFCVEEDKSFFTFAERYSLLLAETLNMEKVKVLRSGKLIISTATFPSYFMKDSPDKYSAPSLDIEIFGKHIAPALGINFRFAGTEPLCLVTRSYNQAMREILPKYGIEFVEIERLALREEHVSASKIRELMTGGDLGAIAALAPPATLELVKRKMRSSENE